MDIGYLYSIIDLYLKNEDDSNKACLNIKKNDTNIEFRFTMRYDNPDKTIFTLPIKMVNDYWYKFLNRFKSDLIIIDEKYEYDKIKETCYYYVILLNGRTISFDGFNTIEINGIRNCLYTIKIDSDTIRVKLGDEKTPKYKPQLSLQVAGFSSFKTILFIILFILDALFVSLMVCKLFMK